MYPDFLLSFRMAVQVVALLTPGLEARLRLVETVSSTTDDLGASETNCAQITPYSAGHYGLFL